MKEKSHRATRRCYRSGVDALRGTDERRLDGYRLYKGDGFAKPVVARFDRPDASTDGGSMLVKALDTQLGLTERLAACLDDARDPGKVLHETVALFQQRIFGLCAGYADCNDAARLVHDPIHKLMVGRDPLTGLGLASQPTLSRFENAVRARELRRCRRIWLVHILPPVSGG